MRILIDTNVLISAALSANGTPYQAYKKAASYPNHGLICEQNVEELKRIFNKKFPNRLAALDHFLSVALLTLELVAVPDPNLSVARLCNGIQSLQSLFPLTSAESHSAAYA